tara:strand:+ start:248 stop:463 length:216 start_codon:yes stop_codon:yes gene_type:complete
MIITGILLLLLIAIHMYTTNKNSSIEIGLFWGLFFGFAFTGTKQDNVKVKNFQVAFGFININITTYEWDED